MDFEKEFSCILESWKARDTCCPLRQGHILTATLCIGLIKK